MSEKKDIGIKPVKKEVVGVVPTRKGRIKLVVNTFEFGDGELDLLSLNNIGERRESGNADEMKTLSIDDES